MAKKFYDLAAEAEKSRKDDHIEAALGMVAAQLEEVASMLIALTMRSAP